MTTIGTIEKKPDRPNQKRIWVSCPRCHEERWAPYTKHKFWHTRRLCRPCNTGQAAQEFNLDFAPKNLT